MKVTFYGGAGGVTGSKHLVEWDEHKLLFDCGTFQGLPDVRSRNRGFPFPPDEIEYVVLSHAHIDHCGMLPLLVQRGFRGKIFATPGTRDVAAHMMEDAAGIEEQDAAYRQRHHIGAPDEREPLFTRQDVTKALRHFEQVDYVRYQSDWTTIADNIKLKFYDAGHILGSAVSVLQLQEGGKTHRIAYTGDVGAPNTPLMHDPEVPVDDVETVLMESTYGNRTHKPLDDALRRLAATIKEVVAQDGKIVIPAFSLGRTQVLVYALHKLTDSGHIPRLPIYVDSPLATNITGVFRSHSRYYDPETRIDFGTDDAPLAFRNLKYTQSREDSKALNTMDGPFIVISASGMMTAGRVIHHLKHTLHDRRNALFITGYQAAGTMGRRILEGAHHVELMGDRIPVRARVEIFNEFSAHADGEQLVEWLGHWQGVSRVALVHGEPSQADQLKDRIQQDLPNATITRPNEGDVIEW